ncbi:MAG: lamin tail domain-containing protein, partial [Thaumarchaeota archaeon]|nr:lamin tail domain-containing protein [Nitrososphaerota archaeon]
MIKRLLNSKRLLYIFLILFISVVFEFNAQTQIYVLDFESGQGSGYTTSVAEFNDGGSDYFTWTDNSSVSGNYSGVQGTYFFAAQDIDGEVSSAQQDLLISNINIAGYTDLELRVYLAEDDDGTNEDWDAGDYTHFSVDLDNTGSYTDVLNIESSVNGANSEPAIDTNFDGIGDGTRITNIFSQFIADIPTTGSSLDLRVRFNLDSGDEDIAIDHIEVYGISSGNQPPQITNITQTPTSGNVTSSDAVSISADVTDSDSNVANVELHWGTSTGNLSNTIVMSLSSGDTYLTDTDIPAQADGTTVYYEIEAMDNAVEISTSSEQNYSVFDPISLIISEVADPGNDASARFLEVYNNGSSTVDFNSITVYLERYANGGTNPQSFQLTGSLDAGEYYVIANNGSNFNIAFGFNPDAVSGIISGNGDDVYALYVNGDESSGSLLDIYGEIGIDGTGEAWEYVDSRAVRNNLSYTPSSTWIASQWDIFSADVSDMTPGRGEPTVYTYNNVWSPANPVGNATASDEVV